MNITEGLTEVLLRILENECALNGRIDMKDREKIKKNKMRVVYDVMDGKESQGKSKESLSVHCI